MLVKQLTLVLVQQLILVLTVRKAVETGVWEEADTSETGVKKAGDTTT